MDFLLAELPFILFFLVIFPWIAAPVAVYFISEMPALPEFFPLTDAEIESCTTPTFIQRSRAMESLGFEQVANLQWITPATRTFTRMFYRPSTQECSHVSEITSDVGVGASTYYMEFITEFVDGPLVETNNSDHGGVVPIVPQKRVSSLPGVDDAATLYRVHRYLTRAMDRPVKPLPSRERIAESIEIESVQGLRYQAEAGYMYHDHARGTYRPTAVGAALMSWKLVWPAGMIRRALMRRNAVRLVRASAQVPS